MHQRGLQTSRSELVQCDRGVFKKVTQLRCIELQIPHLGLIAISLHGALGWLAARSKPVPRRIRINGEQADPKSLWDLDVEPVVSSLKEPVNELNRVVPVKHAG